MTKIELVCVKKQQNSLAGLIQGYRLAGYYGGGSIFYLVVLRTSEFDLRRGLLRMLSENYTNPQTWHLPVDSLLVPEVPLDYSGCRVCVWGGLSFDHRLHAGFLVRFTHRAPNLPCASPC